MMSLDNENDSSRLRGIPIERLNFCNGFMVDDPLLKGCSFEVPDQGYNQNKQCPISNLPSVEVTEDTSNNNGNSFGVEETHAFPDRPSVEARDLISNNGIDGTDVNMSPSKYKPVVGMEFDTIDELHLFWERYARDTCFRSRIRDTRKRKSDGVIRSRTYVCSKEGVSCEDRRNLTTSMRRPPKRCGCGVVMTVSLVKGKGVYRVMNFVEEHNHVLEWKRNTPQVTCVEGQSNNLENGESVCKPVVGMEFDTNSHAFWEQYARDVGFIPRIRSTKRSNVGALKSRNYVCSREGKSCGDPSDNSAKRHTRCGCGVIMMVYLVNDKGTFRVKKFVEEHNHDLNGIPSIGGGLTSSPPNLTNLQAVGIDHVINGEQNTSRLKACEDEVQGPAKSVPKKIKKKSVPNGVSDVVLEGPLLNLTNAQRMGILRSEFMQLAYRAVTNDEVFEGVCRLIKEGHSLADKH